MAAKKYYRYNGRMYSLVQISAYVGIDQDAMRSRIKVHGVKKAVEMGAEDQRRISKPEKPLKTTKWKDAGEPWDSDLILTRNIERWEKQGMPVSEMIIKARVGMQDFMQETYR